MATLARVGEERTADVGDVLFRVGDQRYPFIAILEGEVRAVRRAAGEGRDLELRARRRLTVCSDVGDHDVVRATRLGAGRGDEHEPCGHGNRGQQDPGAHSHPHTDATDEARITLR